MKKVLFLIALIVVITGFSIYLNSRDKFISIGLVADLTSSNSSMGISARNGVQLSMEEINEGGGVDGYKLKLLVKDHGGDKERCQEVTKELVIEGVKVIIGPTLSGMADSVIKGTEGSDVLIIAATVSADYLKGKDDNFLRIASPSSRMGVGHYDIAIKKGSKKIALIVDDKNEAYAHGVVEGFEESIKGDEIIITKKFYYKSTDKFSRYIEEIGNSDTDSILLINSGVDGGKFVQMYNQKYPLPQVYGSGWTKVSQMEKHAGKLMEGIIFVDNYRSETPGMKEKLFIHKYREKFHIDSNTVTMFYYEALDWFYRGVQAAGSLDNSDIKNGIINLGTYRGLFEDYSMDQYGDAIRNVQYFIYLNGQYRVLYD